MRASLLRSGMNCTYRNKILTCLQNYMGQEATESFAFLIEINETEDAFIDELLFNIWNS